MTKHISLRLAWHDNGWNGHICKDPEKNVYCAGRYSYPGDRIKNEKNLQWELSDAVCGKSCASLIDSPPCVNSINAFGKETIKSYDNPPKWFKDDSKRTYFELLPATACTWPYDAMYDDSVKNQNPPPFYDPKKRQQKVEEYFSGLENDKSLIVYYANYSNPFSTESANKYVVVGISRFKSSGKIRLYQNVSAETIEKYGGFTWQMPITSYFPEQGFRIPYEKYLDQQEILNKILFVPENARCFKYGTRIIEHDDILSLVERFLEIVKTLIEIGDTSENWSIRKNWLLSLFSQLWQDRGPYPGMLSVLEYLKFQDGMEIYRSEASKENSNKSCEEIFNLLEGKSNKLSKRTFSQQELSKIRRQFALHLPEVQSLLKNVFPRFGLTSDQITKIISDSRINNGIKASLKEIEINPYVICEEYIGDDLDDTISFSKIDNGVLPYPDFGLIPLFDNDSPERFRALCVDRLKKEIKHSFVSAEKILNDIDAKLDYLPDWKKVVFSQGRYLEVDREFISNSVQIREHESIKYLYLKNVYENERKINQVIESLLERDPIKFTTPITSNLFFDYLHEENSKMAISTPNEYKKIISTQADICSQLFSQPIAVLSGAAGTGKTTLISALIKAIKKAHGTGISFNLLAPTGKAADRIKEKTGLAAQTIHSFLAKRGWLNDNLTYKTFGGKVEDSISILIIDETSMLDIDLIATLFKAINWNSVQRLILVGDPNQLPPIGRGKVFSDIINRFKDGESEHLGKLTENVRQLENRLNNSGTGILDLAGLYIQEDHYERKFNKSFAEDQLKKIQIGGKVESDLTVKFWRSDSDLQELLINSIKDELEEDLHLGKPMQINLLWNEAHKAKIDGSKAGYIQAISPYRGEVYGTEHLNEVIQKAVNGYWSQRYQLDGITIFDKVIQARNRPKSNPIIAFDLKARDNKKIEVFNGEMGFVYPHSYDLKTFKKTFFWLKRFQVVFDRKENFRVSYGSELGKYMKDESPEEWLELAYTISVHKAQGSEFERVFLVLPKSKSNFLNMELLYTAITRAQKHLTILIQDDISTLVSLMRLEKSAVRLINSSVFEFKPLPLELLQIRSWYEEGKIHHTLSDHMVRSKSEVIISNILHERGIEFSYEKPLFSSDGKFYLPDFTIQWHGIEYYWEHLGLMDIEKYKNHWQIKKSWYEKFFPGKLITTEESGELSSNVISIINNNFQQ